MFCSLWTLTGLPALTLPLLTGEGGMPLGVQLIGERGDDARLLRTANWLMEELADNDRSTQRDYFFESRLKTGFQSSPQNAHSISTRPMMAATHSGTIELESDQPNIADHDDRADCRRDCVCHDNPP